MDIYDPVFVERLFDDMAQTYERVNTISSFGFSVRWRKQFIRKLNVKPETVLCDLMTGMGECWPALAHVLPHKSLVIGLDNSDGMLQHARRNQSKFPHLQFDLRTENVLQSSLATASVDCIVIGFGLKTFNTSQIEQLAAEMRRILKPGGQFSLIEVSVPPSPLLRLLYLFYLKRVIPLIGSLFLGNPETYRMLGIYTEQFGNCTAIAHQLQQQGFTVQSHSYFFGCATGVSGRLA